MPLSFLNKGEAEKKRLACSLVARQWQTWDWNCDPNPMLSPGALLPLCADSATFKALPAWEGESINGLECNSSAKPLPTAQEVLHSAVTPLSSVHCYKQGQPLWWKLGNHNRSLCFVGF